ncbi:MAG: hypothetical protein JKY88_13010 [Pseudomonadales bacterium]|nr:hypothetical protein [Pseudomonadales bacterium]
MKLVTGLVLLIASLLIVSSYFFFLEPQSNTIKLYPQSTRSVGEQMVQPEPSQPSIDESILPSSNSLLPSSNSLWQSRGEAKDTPHLRSDITDAELVQYDRTKLLEITNGAIVEVYIPQLNENLAVLITSSELLSSGNVSIIGHLKSNEIFSFVMTLGENSMFATIGTAAGIYNVSGNRELAWVIPALSLRKQMNTDVLDYRSINPEMPSTTLDQNG